MFYVYFQVRYCEDMGITPGAASRLFVYYGLASCTGRLVSGRLCDFEKVNTFYVYQVAELVLGTSMLMVTLATSYMHMIIFIVIYGFCDGVFITTLNVLLITCVSHQKVAVAIGWEMQVSSFFLASGPPVAGEFCADWNSVHCCEDLNLNLNLTQTCYEKLAFNTFKTNQKWDRFRQLLSLVRDLTCIKVRTDLKWIKDTLDSNQSHISRYLCQTFDKRPRRAVIDQNQKRPLQQRFGKDGRCHLWPWSKVLASESQCFVPWCAETLYWNIFEKGDGQGDGQLVFLRPLGDYLVDISVTHKGRLKSVSRRSVLYVMGLRLVFFFFNSILALLRHLIITTRTHFVFPLSFECLNLIQEI